MNINLRRLIYIIVIIVFLVAAPLIILGSSGYRYDFKKNKIVKTGSLILDSYPRGAAIYLEGQPYQNPFSGGTWKTLSRFIASRDEPEKEIIQKTPLIINNLIPNEYFIELKKPKYQTWSKKLEIKTGKATFADSTLLFLKQPKIKMLAPGKILLAKTSPDNQKIAFVTNQEVNLIHLKTEKITTLLETQRLITNIDWSPNGKKLLITEQNLESESYAIIVPGTEEPYSIKNFKNYLDLKNIKWDPTNENLLYASRGNIIYQINLFTKSIRPFLQITTSQEIDNFLVDKNWNIFYLKPDKTCWCLKRVSLLAKGATLTINSIFQNCLVQLPLPYSTESEETHYKLAKISDNILLLTDEKNQKIWVTNIQTEKIIIEAKARDALFLPSSQNLIYYNDFEVWRTDVSREKEVQNTRQIISRFSSEIDDLVLENQANYLLLALKFANQERICGLDLDSRDRYNIISLFTLDKLYQLIPTRDRDNMYIHGVINGTDGIYKIKIH